MLAGPDTTVNVTGKPELAVACTLKDGSPTFLSGNCSNRISCERFTSERDPRALAATYLVSPDCSASTSTGPAPVPTSVSPFNSAGPDTTRNVTCRPELASALSFSGSP